MYCEILMSMLGYSNEALFQYQPPSSNPFPKPNEHRVSKVGRDIRQLTEHAQDFHQIHGEIKGLLIKFGDVLMIDSNKKINSILEGGWRV